MTRTGGKFCEGLKVYNPPKRWCQTRWPHFGIDFLLRLPHMASLSWIFGLITNLISSLPHQRVKLLSPSPKSQLFNHTIYNNSHLLSEVYLEPTIKPMVNLNSGVSQMAPELLRPYDVCSSLPGTQGKGQTSCPICIKSLLSTLSIPPSPSYIWTPLSCPGVCAVDIVKSLDTLKFTFKKTKPWMCVSLIC